MSRLSFVVGSLFLLIGTTQWCPAADQPARRSPAAGKRVLLLGQKPDSHPKTTHEYMAAARIMATMLQDRGHLKVVIIQADDPWTDGPELLDGADAVVVFLTEGAKWVTDEPARWEAFQRFGKRGGGLTCLHWGSGTREAAPVANFVSLFGGCHGGPDRKYRVADFELKPVSPAHPITSGIGPFKVHDELYYDMKFPVERTGHTSLVRAEIMGGDSTVAWSWERPGGGRSFGFTGLHFHDNWKLPQYRRLVLQGILWTLDETIPARGLEIEIKDQVLQLPEESPKQ